MPDKIGARLLREHERAVSAGAAFDDLEFGPVPDDEEWFCDWVSCVDETNALTKREVAVKSGGMLYWVRHSAVTTAALRVGLHVEQRLSAGESLIVRLTGCTASDVIRAWLLGEYFELGG